jgi:hypothetical protein
LAVTGGEYRLVSPVFPKPSLCEDLGESRIRPRQLQSVALTNEPNIKGARPLTNREPVVQESPTEIPNRWSDASRASALAARRAKNEARKAAALEHLKQLDQQRRDNRYKLKPLSPISTATVSTKSIKSFNGKSEIPKSRYYFDGAWYDNQGNFVSRSKPARGLANRSGVGKLYKWVLGKTKSGTHCPGCQARAGKVKTASEWKAMGKTACGSQCKCKLIPVKT